ncbi:MAG: Protein of unknown function (DUF1553)/Protein of unknown function (DUF1549)/Planctomycete [Chthoniobacteraceae bacterium]|nr:Protein of unknown function (DUF1553)/Protein of unknown function (DUF1549)/Planctomycete [Chthoniobacteraceae bacterium]
MDAGSRQEIDPPNPLKTSPLLLAFFCAATARAQFTITELNGGPFLNNLSTLASSSAFGRDEIGGGGLPQHKIANIRDGIYGNGNSWIGDSANSYIGISLGPTPVSIGRFAFGRDNTGVFSDRTAGLYTLQYTLAPNPNAATSDALWTTIGTINHAGGDAGILSTSRRHAWNFAPVLATGVRLIAPGSSFADGTDVDEFEVAPFAAAPFTLQTVGGTMHAGNIALGGVAFAKDVLTGYDAHSIPHINDGIYGNANSWIGNSLDSFAGVRFSAPTTIDRVAFGRDNSPFYTDRAAGYYLVQYTTAAGADNTTPDASWTNIGPVYLDPADPDRALRHEYSFAPVAGATALRIIGAGAPDGAPNAAAIDELEVYSSVPEPGSALLMLTGAAALAIRRRSKK